jgi:hypothetical protein
VGNFLQLNSILLKPHSICNVFCLQHDLHVLKTPAAAAVSVVQASPTSRQAPSTAKATPAQPTTQPTTAQPATTATKPTAARLVLTTVGWCYESAVSQTLLRMLM